MKSTLKLTNPIMINNEKVSELTYDTNEITAAMFSEAEARKKIAAGTKNVSITPTAEFDFSFHLYCPRDHGAGILSRLFFRAAAFQHAGADKI